jgi:hypothetical protein
MTFANDPTDPANMTPEERVAEVAAILAEGVLRLRRRAAVPVVPGDVSPAGNPLESGQNGLDEYAGTSPHGHRG